MADTPLSTGQVAKQLGAPIWAVRRAVDALLPNAERCGQNRIVPADAVKRLENVLREKGQLPK